MIFLDLRLDLRDAGFDVLLLPAPMTIVVFSLSITLLARPSMLTVTLSSHAELVGDQLAAVGIAMFPASPCGDRRSPAP
jgi:hypothetical protein